MQTFVSKEMLNNSAFPLPLRGIACFAWQSLGFGTEICRFATRIRRGKRFNQRFPELKPSHAPYSAAGDLTAPDRVLSPEAPCSRTPGQSCPPSVCRWSFAAGRSSTASMGGRPRDPQTDGIFPIQNHRLLRTPGPSPHRAP